MHHAMHHAMHHVIVVIDDLNIGYQPRLKT